LLAPGGAFGEDAPQDLDLRKLGLKAIPAGLNKYNGIWNKAIFNGYDFANDPHPTVGYLVSAVVGILVVGVVVFVLVKLVALAGRRGQSRAQPSAPLRS
jgi:cobalt/nickel transport system permease protein